MSPAPVVRDVLFICTHNAARSQMAEGVLRHRYGDRFRVVSAGTKPAQVHPLAVRVMAEIGVDISRQHAKPVDTFTGRPFAYVITVCDQARESCPVFPAARTLHWSLPDPSSAPGETTARLAMFRAVRDELTRRITATFGHASSGR